MKKLIYTIDDLKIGNIIVLHSNKYIIRSIFVESSIIYLSIDGKVFPLGLDYTIRVLNDYDENYIISTNKYNKKIIKIII